MTRGTHAAAVMIVPVDGPGLRLCLCDTLGASGTPRVLTIAAESRDLAPGLARRLGEFCVGRQRVVFDRPALSARWRAFAGPGPADPFSRAADLCLLSHLVHPEHGDHRLEAIARRLELEVPAPEAVAHALAVAQAAILRGLLRQLLTQPAAQVELLRQRLDDAGLVELDLITAYSRCIAAAPPRPVDEQASVEESAEHQEEAEVARGAPVGLAPRLDDAEIQALFAAGGLVAAAVDGYVVRTAQTQLALAVASAIRRDATLMVEAGTGVGKSLGYLVPLVLHAARTSLPVVVATHTKSLQAQLLDKDLPGILRALDVKLRVTLVKGRRDYLCGQRVDRQVSAAFESGDAAERTAAIFFERLAQRSEDGDLERVSPWLLRRVPAAVAMRDAVRCDHSAGRRCRWGARCFYPRIAARAARSHLLIANHALALRWPGSFPQPQVMVFDEAHALLDVATEAFSKRCDERAMRRVFLVLTAGRRTAGLASMLARLERRGVMLPPGIRDRLLDLADDAQAALSRLDRLAGAVAALVRIECAAVTGGEARRLRLCGALREREEAVDVLRVAEALAGSARRLIGSIGEIRSELWRDGLADDDPRAELMVELASVTATLEANALAIDAVLASRPDEVCFIEPAVGERGTFALVAAPIDVAAPFYEQVIHRCRAAILTSATLRVDGDFAFLAHRLGIDRHDAERQIDPLALGSPFHYEAALRVFVPLGGGDVLARSVEAAATAAARAILIAAASLGGRTIGLFNAKARLLVAADLLREPLARHGIELLAAGRDGHPLIVLERFRRASRAVLLGSRAFYEGIDLKGCGLACAVLDRIPFESPDDPVHAARMEAFAAAGQSGFAAYSLPRALLLLRQAAGRLIRDERDRGTVVLLDPRAGGGTSYSQAVQRAIPGTWTIGPEGTVWQAWRRSAMPGSPPPAAAEWAALVAEIPLPKDSQKSPKSSVDSDLSSLWRDVEAAQPEQA